MNYNKRTITIATLKTKDQMTPVELLNLRLGRYLTGKIIDGKIYYRVD